MSRYARDEGEGTVARRESPCQFSPVIKKGASLNSTNARDIRDRSQSARSAVTICQPRRNRDLVSRRRRFVGGNASRRTITSLSHLFPSPAVNLYAGYPCKHRADFSRTAIYLLSLVTRRERGAINFHPPLSHYNHQSRDFH